MRLSHLHDLKIVKAMVDWLQETVGEDVLYGLLEKFSLAGFEAFDHFFVLQ